MMDAIYLTVNFLSVTDALFFFKLLIQCNANMSTQANLYSLNSILFQLTVNALRHLYPSDKQT